MSSFAFLVPFAAGNLIYIAGSDLVPELHKESCENFSMKESVLQFLAIALGIGIMMLLLLME
jgi:zinc transporter ZupT